MWLRPLWQVIGRLAGDQRGVVLDALVSEGVMEVLLAIVGACASSAGAGAAESALSLLLLADLAAGSERAKVREGERGEGRLEARTRTSKPSQRACVCLRKVPSAWLHSPGREVCSVAHVDTSHVHTSYHAQ